jgi:hypothetical protein
MDNITTDNKYFLFIGSNKISLGVLNYKNEIFYTKDILLDNLFIPENLEVLDNFFSKNIFDIEKDLKEYVKNINLIIENKEILSINLSTKYNYKGTIFDQHQMNTTLIDAKNQFKKNIGNYEIIHMMINKFIINDIDHSYLPAKLNSNNLSLEIRFICMHIEFRKKIDEILSKYQISLNKIIFYDYLKELQSSNNDKIFNTADKILKGLNQNEIFLFNKNTKDDGFFEKFFNFFN